MSAIAIFVKTPGLSPVKSRLARTIGEDQANSIYRLCAETILEAADRAAVGPVYWALAEPETAAQDRWHGAECISQGFGGLGERMHRVLTELVHRHDSALLLGADAPQIDPTELRRATTWLDHASPRRAIGPARDGGFWTFGANHIPPLERWSRVAYSRPDTLSQFIDAMGQDAEWLQLPTLTDLDTEADLAPVAEELRKLHQPLQSQLALMEALDGP